MIGGDSNHMPENEALATVRRFRSAPRAVVGGLLLFAALVTLWVGTDSLTYFFRSSTPEDLGAAREALRRGSLGHNRHVSLIARPILESEGRSRTQDPAPGCIRGPVRTMHYNLVAETGDRLVLRTAKSLRATQRIPKDVRFTGRLLRLDRLPDTLRMYKRFLYHLTDCASRPKECERRLLVGTDISREVLLSQLGKEEARVRGEEGHRIALQPKTPLFLFFEYPDQWDYQVLTASKEEAIARVKGLGVPWYWVETRGEDQLFVIQAPRARGEEFIKAQRRGGGYGISARAASFLVTFDQIGRRGDELVLHRVGPGFPEDFVLPEGQREEKAPELEAVTRSGLVRVPLGRFVKASYHGPRHLPDEAFILLQGQSPRQAWPALVIAALALAGAVFGLILAVLGLRRPSRPV